MAKRPNQGRTIDWGLLFRVNRKMPNVGFPFWREGCVAYSYVPVSGATLLIHDVEADGLRRSRCNIWDDPKFGPSGEI
ncbi:hypothetical protein ACN38_g10713 [Penicillium nordicum]|uniref:Uncharacterized protein n=1 Tax=Penicillium nordicum TaxID=229535 RepID=A0A0M9WBG9_9EURO|nr:hypothetical protein ACN38_g10713 [Penicillium nordicum]